MGKRGFRDHRERDQSMGHLEGLGEESQGWLHWWSTHGMFSPVCKALSR